jgi:hypothetical protein
VLVPCDLVIGRISRVNIEVWGSRPPRSTTAGLQPSLLRFLSTSAHVKPQGVGNSMYEHWIARRSRQ